MRAILVAFAFMAAVVPARAATITLSALPDGHKALTIEGKIEDGDQSTFTNDLAKTPGIAGVYLSSPGGNMAASLAIGQAVHKAGLVTVVPSQSDCASGCGLIWLAGTSRFVASDARVGFHAVSAIDKDNEKHVAASSAIIGAYMARLGLSDAAIGFMNDQPPDRMAWLGWDDADRLGVHITPFSKLLNAPQIAVAPKL